MELRGKSIRELNIVVTQAFDDMDRVQERSWSDGTATVTYTYDGPASQFRLGRLASIAQGTSLVSYAYNVFGWMTQDGILSYTYDANGNRNTIGYGGGLFACYGFDDADRQSTLSLGTDSSCIAGAQSLVTASSYLAGGPLASLNTF